MNEYPAHARELVAVRLSLRFEPLLIRLDGSGIRAHLPIELPSAVVPHSNGSTGDCEDCTVCVAGVRHSGIFVVRPASAGEPHRVAICQTSFRRPDAYLCNKLAISVW